MQSQPPPRAFLEASRDGRAQVLESQDGIIGIGSGGAFATAAVRRATASASTAPPTPSLPRLPSPLPPRSLYTRRASRPTPDLAPLAPLLRRRVR